MAKYRKKPIVVEAEQYFPGVYPWPDGVKGAEDHWTWINVHHEGDLVGVAPGDWIITGVKGERYPCKPDIFEMTYEAVEDK